MANNQYKNIRDASLETIIDWARDVNRNRRFDVEDFLNLQANTPRVLPVPTSSTDISGAERVGDLASDASFLYYVAESGGALVWRRIAGSSF